MVIRVLEKEIKLNFILHDCTADKLELDKSKLQFYFYKGVYILEDSDKKINPLLSTSCKLIFNIEKLLVGKEYQHITIYSLKNNKRKELSFSKLIVLIEKYKFKIYLDYYSPFARSVLMKGKVGKLEIEISITEVENISIILND